MISLILAELNYVKCDRVGALKNVGLVTLNKPRTFNSLSRELMHEVSLYYIIIIKRFDLEKCLVL